MLLGGRCLLRPPLRSLWSTSSEARLRLTHTAPWNTAAGRRCYTSPASLTHDHDHHKPTATKSKVAQDIDKADTTPTEQERSSDTPTGKLTSTSSHLFKLTLPLHKSVEGNGGGSGTKNVAFLLHSQQPLSYLTRLIEAELEDTSSSPSPSPSSHRIRHQHPIISYVGFDDPNTRWSPSTEIGDFIKQAAKIQSFTVLIQHPAHTTTHHTRRNQAHHTDKIAISVPTFEDRTRFLRARLYRISQRLASQLKIKTECDLIASRGARRLATTGALLLISYWALVFRLTFFSSYGWDLMEPVTYLTGLSTVIGGYAYFLHHNRAPSYRSVMHSSVTRRQRELYVQRGFREEEWEELVREGREVRRVVRGIAGEYEVEWDGVVGEVGEGEPEPEPEPEPEGAKGLKGREEVERERKEIGKAEEVLDKAEKKHEEQKKRREEEE